MKIAKDIIDAVCTERGVNIDILRETNVRTAPVVAARKDAIERLRAQHLSAQSIAHFMNMTAQAVTYYINPNARVWRDRATAKFQAKKRQMQEAVLAGE